MRTNHRYVLIATLFAGLVARPVLADKQMDPGSPLVIPPSTAPAAPDSSAPPAPASVTTVDAVSPVAPATTNPPTAKTTKKHAKKHVAAKKAVHKKQKPSRAEISVPLVPGPATVVAHHVNVRGKPTIYSEVLDHLTNGEPVTVIEEITRDNPKPQDPTVWAKIALPGNANLWVSAQYVDTNKTVTVKKLNLRTGPGENYSVSGTLSKGDVITDIGGTNGWIEIQPTATNAYAFVAAAYLKQENISSASSDTNAGAANIIPAVPPTPTTVAESNQVAPPPAGAPNGVMPPASVIPITTDTNNPDVGAVAAANIPEASNAPAATEPPQPRIVQREGIVQRTFSILAPSSFELVNPDTGRTVNYLYTDSKELDLKRYKGLHIIVTGEESLDDRWKNTPVITIQKIQVLD